MPASPLTPLTGTTPVGIVAVKPLARFIIKRIMAFNGDTAAHRIQVGFSSVNTDGSINTATFTQILPDIVVPAGQTIVIDTPPAVVSSTQTAIRAITARLEGAAASPVLLVLEWVEA